jgi:hypothetical protein
MADVKGFITFVRFLPAIHLQNFTRSFFALLNDKLEGLLLTSVFHPSLLFEVKAGGAGKYRLG